MSDLLDLLDLMTADADPTERAPEAFYAGDRWTFDEVLDAFERARKRADAERPGGCLGIYFWSHMWHQPIREAPVGAHPIETVSANLGCAHDRTVECQCTGRGGGLVYRAWCGQCRRWTRVHDDEGGAVEDMHDQCWPGWRALPEGKAADRDDHWTQLGAPIVTERGAGGTRPIPGRSPFGGYDLPAPTA